MILLGRHNLPEYCFHPCTARVNHREGSLSLSMEWVAVPYSFAVPVLLVIQVARYAKEDALGKYMALLTLSPM